MAEGMKFSIEGMSCAACSASVERAVSALDGVSHAEVNLLAKTLVCDFDDTLVDADSIMGAVERAGFSASLYNAGALPSQNTVKKVQADGFTPVRTRLIVSLCFLLPLMYISMGHMFGLWIPPFLHGASNAQNFAFIQFLLTLPVLYVNRKFFYGGTRAIISRAPNMDTLVSVGAFSAVAYGVYLIFAIGVAQGRGDVTAAEKLASGLYFESGAMILTLVTVGKLLEERAKTKSGDAVKKLLDLSPKTATVRRGGREIVIPADKILLGDLVIISPGDRIPADGVIVEGGSSVDASALTGESIPVEKNIGDSVMSASLNLGGAFVMRAERVGEDTTLAKITALVENAGASKAPAARLADKVAGIFVPVVISIAVAVTVLWLFLGEGVGTALNFGISVLVISCPCALGLATPVAITVAVGRCASKGILIKSATALETLAACDVAAFDKTGTVTEGTPSVTDIIPLYDGITNRELLSVAASLEQHGGHPLASAVLRAAEDEKVILSDITDFMTVPGRGIYASVDGKRYFAGNAEYMRECGTDTRGVDIITSKLLSEGKTLMYFSDGERLLGVIAVFDTVRNSSAEAMRRFSEMKLKTVMLTGDNAAAARHIADAAGIDEVLSGLMPQDKLTAIADLKANGSRVVMTGDGINDSPALSAADIGIAVGSASDIALDCADIVLMKSDLCDAAEAVGFSRRTVRIIRQNLFWAFFYNVICIPIAAGALYPLGIVLSPMIAAAAMSVSSLFVVTNALRLYRY